MAGCFKFEKEAVETGKSNSKWPAGETGGEVARGGEVAAVEKLEKLEKLPAVMVQAERETC